MQSYAYCYVTVQKKIKQEFLDTDSVQLETFAYYLRQNLQNTDFLDWKNLIDNVINMIYYRRLWGPNKRGAHSNCYICYYC